jgi:hypothetical protein
VTVTSTIPMTLDYLTDNQRRRADALILARYLFPQTNPEWVLKAAQWIAGTT